MTLLGEIVRSKFWQMADKTRILWVTLLALRERDQIVRGDTAFLAFFAGIPLDDCVDGLAQLADKGAIKGVPGGWLIVPGADYAQMEAKDKIRAYKTAKAREYRAKDGPAAVVKPPELIPPDPKVGTLGSLTLKESAVLLTPVVPPPPPNPGEPVDLLAPKPRKPKA